MSVSEADRLRISIAQMAPVWLNRSATLQRVMEFVNRAADHECQLVVFGEALVPGYPFWIERTDGARFNSAVQKELHAHYLDQAVQIEAGHLDSLCQLAARRGITVAIGCIERPGQRGGHSLYCSLVYIDATGDILSVHRKLMPTYEERLTWSPGDGHGLRTHRLGAFTVGGLNCWENWMPLPRAALYAMGEDLHLAIWPGGFHNTHDLTRFLAKEGRSYVVSASGLMTADDIPADCPHAELIRQGSNHCFANGGSCVAAPDGSWVVEPLIDRSELLWCEIDHSRVREERQNFDPAGHYSRPDVTQLHVNRERQSTLHLSDKL